MAQVPEFISLLRVIRDVYYPNMSIWHPEVQAIYNDIVNNIKPDIDNKYQVILQIWQNMQQLQAEATTLPPGSEATATYDPVDNKHIFGIPRGDKGDSMNLDYTVATIADRDALTGVVTGEICFVDETSMIYVAMQDGGGDAIWSTGVPFTPPQDFIGLSDTPAGYSGNYGRVVRVHPSNDALEFVEPEEIGVVSPNYVLNPRIDQFDNGTSEITTAMFGSEQNGYGGYDNYLNATLSADAVQFAGDGYAINENAQFRGKVFAMFTVEFNTLDPLQTIFQFGNGTNGFAVGLDGASALGIFARNAGTLTSIINTGLTLEIAVPYMIAVTDTAIIVMNQTTGEVSSNTGVLDVFEGTYGNAAVGGLDGTIFDTSVITGDATIPYMNGNVYNLSVWDAVDYTGVDAKLALGWRKSSTAGDFLVMPFPGVRLGTAVINYISGAGESHILDFSTGRADEFGGKTVTVSWNIANLTANDASATVEYVIDTDNPNFPGGQYITTQVATPVFIGGSNIRYSVTFDAPIANGVLGPNNSSYVRIIFDDTNVYGLHVDKFKLEVGSFDTGFNILDRSPSWSQTVALMEIIGSAVDDVQNQLNAHVADTENPHSVTADQVGAPEGSWSFDGSTLEITIP